MKIHFLGTNGWYGTDLGNTISTLINTDKFYIILDAGDGIYKIDQYITDDKPIILLLSHVHLDHIIGLHIIAKFLFKQKIDIYGYKSTKKDIKRIINHPYSVPFDDLALNLQIHDLEEGEYNIGFPIKCKLLVHSDNTLGFRMELDNKIITYCTDTGICSNLYELAENADLFITECSYKPGQEKWGWPHLKPEEAAEIAKKSNVKKLILTHFDASYYNTIDHRKNAEIAAKVIFPETIIATDDLELIVD
ncbi:MAG: MBL fold metallo-hydrolase [Candidatus Thorarchaeota archaeon]